MSEIFITSDEHYGHNNIIQFCNRPFSSTEEMREIIIERHNKKVPNKPSYLTIHAGDMFWQTMSEMEARSIVHRLNGRHAFLYGNHDELMERRVTLQKEFEWVRGVNKENTSHSVKFNKHMIVISHFAQRVWQNSHKGSWHVYGHSHGEIEELGHSFDIGVDSHDFEPWSLEEIEAKMAKTESHHVIAPDKVWKTASVAQTAEQGFCKPEVGGSIPSAGSTYHLHPVGESCGFCKIQRTSRFDLAEYFETLARREDA
jgi:calcineurin-like phosphoesterase family protein